MRRLIGPVLVGFGVFLIVAAALVKFYAYPALAKVPANYDGTTMLESEDALVFNSDPDVLATETTDLSIESRTVATEADDAPEGVVVWQNSVTLTRTDGSVFQQTRERAPFDETSGVGVECDACDSYEEVGDGEAQDVVFEGQVYKFPFNTQKKDYQVWDGTVGEASTATFEGETTLEGLHVYKFVQIIEPTVVETREVPGSIFGSKEPSVDADMVYTMVRTMYVEPATGSPVHRVEERVQELKYDDKAVPAFTGTVSYTDEQVEKSVDDVRTKAGLLAGMRMLFPGLMVLVGIVLLGAGLLLNRRAAGADTTHRAPKDGHRPLVSA